VSGGKSIVLPVKLMSERKFKGLVAADFDPVAVKGSRFFVRSFSSEVGKMKTS
jgi:hypothetical protein